MSVMHFGPERFNRIFASLKAQGRDIAFAFGYPAGWDSWGGMDSVLRAWLQDLRRANTATWNRQYADSVQVLTVDAIKEVNPYRNDYELLKSLRGLRYNLVDNGGTESDLNACYKRLDAVIEHVAMGIIERAPEWKSANTWAD